MENQSLPIPFDQIIQILHNIIIIGIKAGWSTGLKDLAKSCSSFFFFPFLSSSLWWSLSSWSISSILIQTALLLHSHWALGTLRLLYLYYERKVSVSMKFTKSPSSSHHLHHHLIIVIFIVIIIIIIIQIFPHAPNRLSRQFNFRINSTSCLKVLHILIMIMSFPYFDNCLIKHCGDFGDNDDYCDHEQFNFSINSTFYLEKFSISWWFFQQSQPEKFNSFLLQQSICWWWWVWWQRWCFLWSRRIQFLNKLNFQPGCLENFQSSENPYFQQLLPMFLSICSTTFQIQQHIVMSLWSKYKFPNHTGPI